MEPKQFEPFHRIQRCNELLGNRNRWLASCKLTYLKVLNRPEHTSPSYLTGNQTVESTQYESVANWSQAGNNAHGIQVDLTRLYQVVSCLAKALYSFTTSPRDSISIDLRGWTRSFVHDMFPCMMFWFWTLATISLLHSPLVGVSCPCKSYIVPLPPV